jgi:hypothetical protein
VKNSEKNPLFTFIHCARKIGGGRRERKKVKGSSQYTRKEKLFSLAQLSTYIPKPSQT